MGNKVRKLNQIERANEFNDQLKALQSKINNCIIQLYHLIEVLSNDVKAEENGAFVGSKIDRFRAL